jgi:glutamate 5-kinase
MLSGLSTRGDIVVDHGAALALQEQNRSLLPAGVSEVRGSFQRGDVVYIVGSEGNRVGCGLVNYNSEDIGKIKGTRSDQVQGILGYHYGDEVVHRNNMVML